MQEVIRGGKGSAQETYLLAKDGRIIEGVGVGFLVDMEGQTCLLGCFRDVTEKRRAERDLRESEEKYRSMMEAMDDPVYICSQDFLVTYMNPAMIRRIGRETLRGPCFKAIENLDERCPWCVHEKVQRGEHVKIEIWSPKDGLHYHVSHSPIFHIDGSISKMTIYRDITQEKLAQRALRNSFSEIKQLKEQIEADYMYLREEIKSEYNFENIVGRSDILRTALFKVEQVAPTDTTVLILGETGTGKELISRAIHDISLRQNRPLIKVNCAALPSNLIESELFGHEKGAFTGAQTLRAGRFEVAHGGTIFLDEIGELPLELQSKLLRVIEHGEFERLGSNRTIKVDVRILAATNRNLEKEGREGRFREDLYYRLNVFPIILPPLREHKEDIPAILKTLISRLNKKMGKRIEKIPKGVIKALQDYSWPGNVRELENVIERAVINSKGSVLYLADRLEAQKTSGLTTSHKKNLIEVEREHIVQMLKEARWRIDGPKGAALALGINPSTLRSKMKKLGIQKATY
jgi:PAS domain S-box-containing protein